VMHWLYSMPENEFRKIVFLVIVWLILTCFVALIPDCRPKRER
jgi:hypothetical protein